VRSGRRGTPTPDEGPRGPRRFGSSRPWLILAAAALVLLGLTPTVVLVVIATFLAGLGVGAALPAISAMLGLETPAEVQGRVFGLSASATALGFGLGPLLAGTIAGVLSISVGLFTMAAVALLLAAVVAFAAREPAR